MPFAVSRLRAVPASGSAERHQMEMWCHQQLRGLKSPRLNDAGGHSHIFFFPSETWSLQKLSLTTYFLEWHLRNATSDWRRMMSWAGCIRLCAKNLIALISLDMACFGLKWPQVTSEQARSDFSTSEKKTFSCAVLTHFYPFWQAKVFQIFRIQEEKCIQDQSSDK